MRRKHELHSKVTMINVLVSKFNKFQIIKEDEVKTGPEHKESLSLLPTFRRCLSYEHDRECLFSFKLFVISQMISLEYC